MLLICGASASGKTEIVKDLVSRYDYHRFITTTTRPKRDHEMDGVDYYFLAPELFSHLEATGGFIETTEYAGHSYGSRADVIRDEMVAILDPQGINAFYTQRPGQDFIVFVTADKATRKYRMLKRNDDLNVIWKRLDADDDTFKPDRLQHIDLNVTNNTGLIEDVSDAIHDAYQAFLRENA